MTVGQQVEFWQGSGAFRRQREGMVSGLLENGKIMVVFLVGGEETHALISKDDLLDTNPIPSFLEKTMVAGMLPSEIQSGGVSDPDRDTEPLPETAVEPGDDDLTEETVVRPELDLLGPKAEHDMVLHRIKIPGHGRVYAVIRRKSDGEWGGTEFYHGVTSLGDMVMGHDEDLVKYACGFGSYDAYKSALDALAGKGTFSHGMLARCVLGELPAFDSREWGDLIKYQIARQGFSVQEHFHAWNDFVRKAILSFKQWVSDFNVEFLAIEIPLGIPHSVDSNGHKVFGYYAQVDFIVTMDDEIYKKPEIEIFPAKKPKADRPKRQTKALAAEHGARHWEVVGLVDSMGMASPAPERFMEARREPNMKNIFDLIVMNPRKRHIAIVDFKSGKNSYPSHALQLQLQVPLVRHNYPSLDLRGLRLYNLHVTDWNEHRASPTFGYSLKEKTQEMYHTAQHYLSIWRRDHARELPDKVLFTGDANLGTSPGENTRLVKYAEYFDEKVRIAIANKFIDIDK
jgi:hypothetical protein